MKKNKSHIVISTITSLCVVFSLFFVSFEKTTIGASTNAQNKQYSFVFDSGTNILDFSESQISARTIDDNNISFYYNGLSQSNGNVASFSENGSFYNPKLYVQDNNKISGITGIKVIYNSENYLSLSYGWLADDEYEFNSHQINSNETYNFGSYSPSYFKLSNLNNSAIDVSSIIIYYSCSEQAPHSHNWDEGTVITPATCEHAGLTEYTCNDCGETKQVVVPAKSPTGEHTYGAFTVLTEPTCVDTGLKVHTCEVCGEEEEVVMPATGVHTYGEWIIDTYPTFAEPGLKHHICSVCEHAEYEEIDQLISVYQITLDLGDDVTEIVDVEASGAYSLSNPVKEGYNFVKWVDSDNNDFPSSGTISESLTVTAVWEVDPTDNFEKLYTRCLHGVRNIQITDDIVLTGTVFVKGNVTIYSSKDVTLTRSPSFAGDLFVVGEKEDGSNPIIDGESPWSLNLGFDGFDKELVIDGNKNNTTVDVNGAVLFINNSATVNVYDGVVISNNNKTSNERVLNYYDSLFYQRLGGAGALVVNGVLNMYGGEFSSNSVNITDLSQTDENIPSYYASYGGAVASISNFNMYGGLISSNQAARGGAIYAGGLNNIVAGTISNNKAFGVAGAIYAYNNHGTEICLGTTTGSGYLLNFLNNESTSNGGALYSMEQVNLRILGHTLFEGNYSNASGGAIFSSSRLVMNSDTANNILFRSNSARSNGGACYFAYNGGSVEDPLQRFTIRLVRSNFESNSANNGGAIYCVGAYLYLTKLSLIGNEASSIGGAIYGVCNDDGVETKLSISVVTFRSNGANEGGAVFLDRKCIFTCSSQCYFYNNESVNNGGAISSHGGIITINASSNVSCYFEENIAGGNGGALYLSYRSNTGENPDPVAWESSVTISQANFNSNQASYGGAIYLTSKTQFEASCVLTSCTFNENIASSSGGAITSLSSTLTITGTNANRTSFSENSASGVGGAIYASASNVSVNNSDFTSNASTSTGGAISFLSCSGATISNSTFTSNSSGSTGGAIYETGSSVAVSSTTFENNVSDANGGAIYLTSSSSEFLDCNFIGNSSTNGSGGAIAEHTNSTVTINGVVAYNNTALNGDGGFALVKNSVIETDTNASKSYIGYTVNDVNYGNSAQSGGAISLSGASGQSINFDTVDINFNTATSGNGGALSLVDSSTATLFNCSLNSNSSYSSGGAIYLGKGNSVTLNNCSFDSNSISSGNGGAIYSYGATINATSTSFSNHTISENGGAIACEKYSNTVTPSLTISNCSFTSNSSANGGAIYADYTTFTFTSGSLVNNSASANGGAIYVRYSTATINSMTATGNTANSGGVFYINRTTMTINSNGSGTVVFGATTASDSALGNSASSGGVFYSTIDANVTINNATFGYNTASVGGAITATHDSGNVLVLNNCTFMGNTATSTKNGGGAIYAVGQSDLTISNCSFDSNGATNGGAIYADSTAPIVISGTEFTSNTSTSGGAIYVTGTTSISISSSELTSNTASSYGGAIFANSDAILTISSSSELSENTARYGGGIYLVGNANVTISSSVISENNATTHGGGIYISENATLAVTNSTISSNIAATNGGGAYIYTTGSSVSFTGCTFDSNVATSGNGGAIYTANSSALTLTNVVGTNNSCSNGYGGFAGVTSNVTLNINGLTLSNNSAKTSANANIRINNSSVSTIVNKDYSYSLNGSTLTSESQIRTMFSLASGATITYETNV